MNQLNGLVDKLRGKISSNPLLAVVIAILIGIVANYQGQQWWSDYQSPLRTAEIKEKAAKVASERKEREARAAAQMDSTLLPPAPSFDPSKVRHLPQAWTFSPPTLPHNETDIIAQLDMKISIDMTDADTVMLERIERDLRDSADASYARLAIADESIRGWTIQYQPQDDPSSANTHFIVSDRRIVVEINPTMIWMHGPHEMTHVLMGLTQSKDVLPRVIAEFIASSAEIYRTEPGGKLPFTYEQINRPILATSKRVTGEMGMINAGDTPLDMFRYQVLRAAGVKIGDDAWHALGRDLYQAAKSAPDGKILTIADVQPFFAKYGIGDAVVFQSTTEPGTYVDMTLDSDGMPLVFYKMVDGQGVEGSFPATFRMAWKKNGKVMATTEVMTDPSGFLVQPMHRLYASMSDTVEITVGTTTYTFTFDPNVETISVQ